MKARSTLARELRELRGMRARACLADYDRTRLDAMIQTLRWALGADGEEWTRPSECTNMRRRVRQEQC